MAHTCASRCRNGDVRIDKGLAPGGDDGVLGGIEVVTGGKSAAASRQTALVAQLLHEQGRRILQLGDGRRGRRGHDGHGVGLDALGGRRGGRRRYGRCCWIRGHILWLEQHAGVCC